MAESKSAYLSADEFLAAIAGELIDRDLKVRGKVVGKVQIRTLELLEVQNAIARYKGDNAGLNLWVLDEALVTPTLNEAQRESVRHGKPGPLLNLAREIMVESGMTDDPSGEGVPLAGGGLS